MTSSNYSSFKKRLDNIISSLDSIKEDIEHAGGFQTDTMSEEFLENMESAVISLQDCIDNLESDEAVKSYKDSDENPDVY
jgi:hypothetical protein